jgi:hypothetical protein
MKTEISLDAALLSSLRFLSDYGDAAMVFVPDPQTNEDLERCSFIQWIGKNYTVVK